MNKILFSVPQIFTPDQASAYLQVDRETIYRYIREGKLTASKLGRTYRIPKQSIDALLFSTRTRPDITLREYPRNQMKEFILNDQLDPDAQAITQRFKTKKSKA